MNRFNPNTVTSTAPMAATDASAEDVVHSDAAMLSCEEAVDFLLARARPPAFPDEKTPLLDCLGRTLAAKVVATTAVPPWSNSAMDGFAVRSCDVPAQGDARLPVSQRVPAGTMPTPLAPGTAARIFTGAPLPAGADAVIIQEHCHWSDEQVVFSGPIEPGANVRPRGNDFVNGETILAAGTRIRPQEMALAAAAGHAWLPVQARFKVALLITGDEVTPPGRPLPPGQIYDSNRYLLAGLLQALGCQVTHCGWSADDLASTRAALLQAAASADLVLATGGVSVGEEDYVRAAVQSLGTLSLWRVRIKPGKPLAFGSISGCDFIGLPGNPVSALVTFLLFVRPFVLRRQGVGDVAPPRMPVIADFEHRAGKRREFLRARLAVTDGDEHRAIVFTRQGSEVLSAAVWAQGLAEVPEGATVKPGDPVSYLPFTGLLA
jgi:molybdopterin molybdotransferase